MSRLVTNTLTLLTGNAGSAILSLLLSVLIGRTLGKAGLGVYAAALAWVYPVALLADAGLSTLITRDLAKENHPHTAADYLHAAAFLRLSIGGGLTLLLLIFAPLLSTDPQVVAGLRLSAPLVIINPFYGAFSAVFRARREMRPVVILNVGMLLAQISLTALVFMIGGDVIAALAVNVLTSLGQLIAAWLVYSYQFSVFSFQSASTSDPQLSNIEVSVLKTQPSALNPQPLLRRAFPFALAAVLAAIQLRAGVILLERLTDSAQVGYFAAASRFLEGGRMLALAFFDALLPTLSLLALQPDRLHMTFRRANWLVLVFGIAFGGFVTLTAPLLLNLTYGADFAGGVLTLQLLAWSLLPLSLKYARGLYWYALGRENIVNIVTAVTLVLQIGLSLWLFPIYGAAGAAGVAIVIEIIGMLLLWLYRPGTQPPAPR